MQVVKGKNVISEPDGVIMAHGVVLKDGLTDLKADKQLVSESLSYVAKMSKGLYSGVLNEDPDFAKFQQKALDDLLKEETEKICKKVVLGVEDKIKNISSNMVAEKSMHYMYGRRGNVQEIDICKEDIIEGKTNLDSIDDKTKKNLKIQDMIKMRSNSLGSLNDQELRYVAEVNKEAEKISKIKKEIRDRVINKKVAKKKAKKTTKKYKKVQKKRS